MTGNRQKWGGGGTKPHYLAIKTNGTLWAWGSNDYGQLGLGHTTNQDRPVQVGTDTDWDRLVSGDKEEGSLSMAFKTNGSLWFWGDDQFYQSGLSEESPYNIPHVQNRLTPIEAGTRARDWKVVSAGRSHIAAVKTDGSLWAWGQNSYSAVGHGSTRAGNPVKAPFQLGTATDWKTVSAGGYFNLAIKNDGTLWSWGRNDRGQLGYGAADDGQHPIARQVGTDRDWKMVSASEGSAFALKNDGSLWTWGGSSDAVPTRVGRESNDWVSVAAVSLGAAVIKSDGSLWIWGDQKIAFPARVFVPDFITGLALHGDAETLPATDQWHYFEKEHRLICAVQQTNNFKVWTADNPDALTSLTARVWVDDRIGYSVKRHYQITPAPARVAVTTTGRVRLYFTEKEFDEFNAVATNLKKLPTRPYDAAGKANLRIEHRNGVSADGSGSPASYPGAAQIINPADNLIIFDFTNRRWEVVFEVRQRSLGGGFWIKTTEDPLPVTFGSIAARLQGGSLWVDFTSEKETNNHHYEIEASTDGKTFKKIGELCSQAPNGNSDTPLSYTFKTAVSGIMGAAGIAGVVLLALAAGAGSRRRRLLPAAIVAISLCVAAACVKHSRESVAHHSPKIWVRIAQVDKDGTKEYSKIVQAVAKD